MLYRHPPAGGVEVLLGHMGGPFWARKDEAAWSIPKGEYGDGEDPFAMAVREFEEEMGTPPPTGELAEAGSWDAASGPGGAAPPAGSAVGRTGVVA